VALTRALDAPWAGQRRRFDPVAGRLIGSRCLVCGATSWPLRAICQRCGSADTEERTLGDRGTLVTYTTVWVPRPGLQAPYVLGQVDLDDGVRIFTHGRELTDGAKVPMPVRLEFDADPEALPPFWFVPEGRSG
jgi:uncharacterized protein